MDYILFLIVRMVFVVNCPKIGSFPDYGCGVSNNCASRKINRHDCIGNTSDDTVHLAQIKFRVMNPGEKPLNKKEKPLWGKPF